MAPALISSISISLANKLRAEIGRRLEAGALSSTNPPMALARAASELWGAVAARSIARPVALPEGLRVVGIGSAVMGGAGKTPIAVALTRELSRRGARAALVGHAYRAAPDRAREVKPTDRPEVVGDDALASARLLDGTGAPVIVAPSRSAALAYARSLGIDIAIVDGLLQASPTRVADAVLVLDEASPWGSRRCPPLGDLRAPEEALLAASDLRVVVMDAAGEGPLGFDLPERAVRLASSIEGAISAEGDRCSLSSLRPLRVGLLLAIARPERIVRALARRGITPEVIVALADHGSFDGLRRKAAHAGRAGVDQWLTTARCSTKLPAHFEGAPVLALDHQIDVLPLAEALFARRAPGGLSVAT